jgi:hypothetical protein
VGNAAAECVCVLGGGGGGGGGNAEIGGLEEEEHLLVAFGPSLGRHLKPLKGLQARRPPLRRPIRGPKGHLRSPEGL